MYICEKHYTLTYSDQTPFSVFRRQFYAGISLHYENYAAPNAGAHCCADYVIVPDLGEWTYTPTSYGGGYSSGAAAEARCETLGYGKLFSFFLQKKRKILKHSHEMTFVH